MSNSLVGSRLEGFEGRFGNVGVGFGVDFGVGFGVDFVNFGVDFVNFGVDFVKFGVNFANSKPNFGLKTRRVNFTKPRTNYPHFHSKNSNHLKNYYGCCPRNFTSLFSQF